MENKSPNNGTGSQQQPSVAELTVPARQMAEGALSSQLRLTYFSNFYDTDPVPMTLADVVDIVRHDQGLEQLTASYRQLHGKASDPQLGGSERKRAKDRADKAKRSFPAVIATAICEGGKETSSIQSLQPMVAADIDHLTPGQMTALRAVIQADPHVCFDAPSPSGNGRRIFIPIGGFDAVRSLWDKAQTDSARLHVFRHMWNQVAEYATTHWGVELDACCAKPAQIYSIAHDASAYYAPDAQPLPIDMSGYEPARHGRKKNKNARTKGSDAERRQVTTADVIAHAQHQARQKNVLPEDGRNNYLYCIASACNRCGASHDEVVEWAIAEMEEPDFSEAEIRKCIGSAYKDTAAFGTERLSDNDIDTAERIINTLASFRFNVFTSRLEVCYHAGALASVGGGQWQTVGERDLKTIFTFVRRQLKVQRSDVEALLFSYDFAPEFHPLRSYLDALDEWLPGDTDHIRYLFDHLILEDPDKADLIYPYFKCWFERMVALGIGSISRNQLVPALIGVENTGKSYFWEVLLPPGLREYYQLIDPSDKYNKDMDILLSQKLLANFDEHPITRRESNTFKAKVSGGTRSIRKPYAHEAELVTQRCSMALTCNEDRYIGFNDGTRRLISIKITGTKSFSKYPLDYEGLYAQAYYDVCQGNISESVTHEQVAELRELNSDFMEVDACEDAILTFFELPTPTTARRAKWLSATEIICRINRGINREEISPTRIGSALTKLGFNKKKLNTIRYRVVEREYYSNTFLNITDLGIPDASDDGII